MDLTAAVHTAAAATLVGRDVPRPKWPKLLRRVPEHDDAELVARAVTARGPAAAIDDLQRTATDPRPAVAAAAKAVLAARGR